MMCGNTSDFIDHPLPKHLVSAHGASHHVWAPGPPPSESGAEHNWGDHRPGEMSDLFQGVCKGLGLKLPLELDILQKLYYLRKGV